MKPTSTVPSCGTDQAKRGCAGSFRLEEFLPYLLSVAANRVSGLLARRYQDAFGLTIPEWRCLAVIGEREPISASGIVDRTAMDKVKVSRTLASLEAKGFVQRAAHPTDGRLALFSFTARGRTVYERIVPLALETEREVLAGLSTGEERALRVGLLSLLKSLEEIEGEKNRF